jgi:hypothetical protein
VARRSFGIGFSGPQYYINWTMWYRKDISLSVGNHFFQTLAKMASGLKLLLAKMKKSSPCLGVNFFFKLANKYQINNTVMFNNLFCRFWQVINLVKKDQHSLELRWSLLPQFRCLRLLNFNARYKTCMSNSVPTHIWLYVFT